MVLLLHCGTHCLTPPLRNTRSYSSIAEHMVLLLHCGTHGLTPPLRNTRSYSSIAEHMVLLLHCRTHGLTPPLRNTCSYSSIAEHMFLLLHSGTHVLTPTFFDIYFSTLDLIPNHGLVDSYGISVSQMTTDMFHLSYELPSPFLIPDLSGL